MRGRDDPARSSTVVLVALGAALVAAAVASAALGAYSVPPGEVLAAVVRRIGLGATTAPDPPDSPS